MVKKAYHIKLVFKDCIDKLNNTSMIIDKDGYEKNIIDNNSS